MQGAYADPRGFESFFHSYWKSWLGRLPEGVRSGLPSTDKFHVAVEPLAVSAKGGREAERQAGAEVRRRLGLSEAPGRAGGGFSLSHSLSGSHGTGLCIGVRWNGACVGVDLEPSSRPVTDAIRMRIAAETMLAPWGAGLSGIQIWCLKEAAFKSCPWNEGTTLAHFWIEGWDADSRIARIGFPPHPGGLKSGSAWGTVAETQGVEAAFAIGIVGVRS